MFTNGWPIVHMAISTFQCIIMEPATGLFKSWLSYDVRQSSGAVSTRSLTTYNRLDGIVYDSILFRCNQYLVCPRNPAVEFVFRLFGWVNRTPFMFHSTQSNRLSFQHTNFMRNRIVAVLVNYSVIRWFSCRFLCSSSSSTRKNGFVERSQSTKCRRKQ